MRRKSTEGFEDTTLVIIHTSGFFSCCSVRLDKIIEYKMAQ